MSCCKEKCIVHGCENRKDEGDFVGYLCAPCYNMLKSGVVRPTASFLMDLKNEATDKESEGYMDDKAILKHISNANVIFSTSEQTHQADALEWNAAMHRLQHIIAARMARRDHPEIFITWKDDVKEE